MIMARRCWAQGSAKTEELLVTAVLRDFIALRNSGVS